MLKEVRDVQRELHLVVSSMGGIGEIGNLRGLYLFALASWPASYLLFAWRATE